MEEIGSGLVVYRASRLEALLGPLQQLLDSQPPLDALAPQTVIAAHPGMKHWLAGALAHERGPRGIVANLDLMLPSVWLDRLARAVLGEAAVALAPYQRPYLRWRIHERLAPERLDALGAPQLQHYLRGPDVARRRFQLADRLARIYSQYLVYRPDWLHAWAQGRPTQPAPGVLAPLWRQLRLEVGLPHRGELLDQLVAKLPAHAAARTHEPLHVFGVSHLAPAELAVLRAVALQRPVVLYVPDPCRVYWAGLRDDRSRLREQVKADALGATTEAMFLEQGHPLLASWGRMGQHFVLALEDSDARIDVRHWQDEDDVPPADTRLQRLQESIRQLRPGLLAPSDDPRAELHDRSLRVHACHTRLRELEVLRDALLRERAERPALKPAEIVVMAPDIQAYVPLLPAVFGEAGVAQGPLPYHLADVAVARAHPLLAAFDRLLDLPASRLTAPEVLDLLAVPEVARRFGLSGADLELIAGWLRNSRVAWALDGEFRARFGVPAIDAHTFAWGVDRMLGGYVFGAEDDRGEALVTTLPDGAALAPLEGLGGPQAFALGALDALLVEVAAFCDSTRRAWPASQWAQRLERHLDALFRLDRDDHRARDAHALLLGFIRALASEPGESGLDPVLEYAVVRDLLRERLTAAPERQRFLLGGVTFCGMVPQRAIPFRVVAVLGLNDGEFPRAGSDGGLDLMAHDRRLGDRDVRSDDRYLFLETVMSAREVLHLSYLGEGARDGKPRNPAAPLAELMTALDSHAGVRGDDAAERPWRVKHPLQPFDPRYFDGSDPRLFSFRQDFAAMQRPVDAAGAAALVADPFVADPPPAFAVAAGAGEGERIVPLREVLAYFRDPARQLLASGLRLRLDALDDDRLREEEPLEATFDALDGVGRRLFFDAVSREAVQAGRALPEAPPDWLRLTGVLPPGRVGEAAWQEERASVAGLLASFGEHPLFAGGLPAPTPRLVDRVIGRHRLQGELRQVYERDGTRWIMAVFPHRKHEGELGLRERIGLFLEWALTRLDDAHGAVRACLVVAGKHRDWQAGLNAWDAAWLAGAGDAVRRAALRADLEARVAGLLDYWAAAQQVPRWYFPKTSSQAARGAKASAVAEAWAGGFSTGERDYAPGYARLLAGDRRFQPDSAELRLLQRDAEQLAAWITLPALAGEDA